MISEKYNEGREKSFFHGPFLLPRSCIIIEKNKKARI